MGTEEIRDDIDVVQRCGVLLLTTTETAAARRSLERVPAVQTPRTARAGQPTELVARFWRDELPWAVLITAGIVSVGAIMSGWRWWLLIVPVLPAVDISQRFGKVRFAWTQPRSSLEMTVAPDRLRVLEHGAVVVDAPWDDVAVKKFVTWQPGYGRGRRPYLRALVVAGPDGRNIDLDTFAFVDSSIVDAVVRQLRSHGRIVLDPRS